jgi:CsoR family transcriptional regulator, copper-sensing transcriptional repressor
MVLIPPGVSSVMEYKDSSDLVKALRRIEGQARGVQRMIEEGRPCDEVVRQVSAMRGAVDRLNHRLVSSNLLACLEDVQLGPEIRHRLDRGLRALSEIRS